MEAYELMIEDWFYRPDCYDQVKEIRYTGVIGIDGMRGLIAFRELESIPITPKILEKNGFIDEMSNYGYRTDNYHVCYYCADERLSINKYGAILDVHCFYVHQLQHAFTLCGIEKEIEL